MEEIVVKIDNKELIAEIRKLTAEVQKMRQEMLQAGGIDTN